MTIRFALLCLIFSSLTLAQAVAGDCVEKYQNRIDKAEDWGRLTYKWPAQIRERKANAQGMINLILQARESEHAQFPGGAELVGLTYRVNRYISYDKRVTVRQVAQVIVQAEESQRMCPDYRNLMDMNDVRKLVQKTLLNH